MYHQNWLEEMDQIGYFLNGSSSSNKFNEVSSSLSTATMNKSMGGGGGREMRIRNKGGGGGSWRSCYKSYCVFAVCWVILSVGSSVAVMAYQNDLSAISSSGSSSSGGSGGISALSIGTGKSNSASSANANSRHGCVWSRTDSNAATSTAASSTTTTSSAGMNMYGNNPFYHQQQSSSLLTSAFSGGSSSTPGGNGVLTTLNCKVRTLNVDFWSNYTFSRDQLESTTRLNVKCSDKLFFESLLSPNLTLFQLRNLREVHIESCKIRKIPSHPVFSSQLRQLDIQTDNAQWSSSVGLEIESGAFQNMGQLEILNLNNNNIWTLDPNLLCPMRKLQKLNVSGNRLTDIDDFGLCPLSISNIDLSRNNIRRLSSNVFNGLKLSELRLEFNQIEELDDKAFQGLRELRLLNMSSNRLVALPPTIFKFNPTLREINLSNNSISALSPGLFDGLPLLLLDISRNSLTSQWVQGSIFSGLLRLVFLNLSHNQLTTISANLFTDLISLQVLDLHNNDIEFIHPDAFKSLKNIHSLTLSRNRLTTVPVLSNFVLRQLYLDHNQIQEIDPLSLKNTSLEDLGLSNNEITQVSLRGLDLITLDLGENKIASLNNDSFHGMRLIGLRLVGNRLEEIPVGFCNHLTNLRVLNLSENRLRNISNGVFSSCPELRVLRLDTNALEMLPNLTNLPSLLWLNVSSNRLRWADYSLLPPTIEWLDLSHNELESLKKPEVVQQQPTGSLRVLDISYNKLRNLDYTILAPTLEILRVNYNELAQVSPDTFIRSRLRRVELIGNKLENLALSALRFPPVPTGKPLPQLYIGGNPFICDCSMEWLTRVNQLAVLRIHPRIVDLDAIVCRLTFPRTSYKTDGGSSLSSHAPTFSNQVIPLVEARPKDFLCQYKSHCFALCFCCEFDACDCEMSCPDNCSCFRDSSWSSNIVQCKSNFTEVPSRIPMDATEIFLDGNKLELRSHMFIGKKNLRSLYLNGSQIETIKNKTFNGLKSLEILTLHDNRLAELNGWEFADLRESLTELYLQNNFIRFINHNTFDGLKIRVLRLDGNFLVDFNVWELTKTNGYLNSVMLSGNPWSCDCDFLVPFRRWVAQLKNTIVVDFALAKCQPTEEQQDGSGNNSSAIMNSGGSTIITTGSTTTSSKQASIISGGGVGGAASSMAVTHPTISSMCAPLSQSSFNYNQDNPALLPSAVSASSSDGGSNNHAVMMKNHISSMGGAARSNLGSLQLSGPYHHAHLENQAGNYQQGFPQNENIIATTAAAGGGGLRRSKTGHGSGGANDDDDDDSSGNSTFFTCLVTFIAIMLVATIAFLVGLVTFRKRGRLSQSSSGWWCWWCFSKCGINSSSSAMPKCLSAPNSSSANEGGDAGTHGLGGNSGDMDYYYYSDKEKLFDAYFIYSQKDEEFVTEKLTCELERGGAGAPVIIHSQQQLQQQQQQQQHYYPASQPGTKKLRLCLHYRDLCLAPDNPWSSEMILSACDASKRVVLVISNNFLNGEWANNHFRTSVHSAIQQHFRKLIVIKLPPVSDQSVSSICSSVLAAAEQQQQRLLQQQQHQQRSTNNGTGGGALTTCVGGSSSNKQSSCTLSSSTQLEWGDKNFWPKFRLMLPTPQIPSTGNNNRNDISASNFTTMSSHGTSSQLPYTTNLNPNGMNFMNAAANNGQVVPYQIPMHASGYHHYHHPSDLVVSSLAPPQHHQQQQQQQQQQHFITLMNWTGQQQQQQQQPHHQQGIPSLSHSSSVHPIPSQLTPQHFGYSNIDGFQNNINSQQTILFTQQPQQPLHFSSSNNNNNNNNNRQSHRQLHHHHQQQHHLHPNHAHPHLNHHPNNQNNPLEHGQHIHSLSQLSNMSSSKSPVEANYSSSAVSSGNEEFDHVYSTLDSPLESPCSDLGPGHVAGHFEGAMISGAQVNRHQIQHSTSSGISSGSDATSGTGGCHPGGANRAVVGTGPPMYFV